MKTVTIGTIPIKPQSVSGPQKMRLIRNNPIIMRTHLSGVPIFLVISFSFFFNRYDARNEMRILEDSANAAGALGKAGNLSVGIF